MTLTESSPRSKRAGKSKPALQFRKTGCLPLASVASETKPLLRQRVRELVQRYQSPNGGFIHLAFTDHLRLDFLAIPSDDDEVKVDAAKKEKSEADVLDQATGQLFKAVKQKTVKKQGRADYSKLRKDGYSERFLARLEES
jgi:hypothetical protein